MKKNKVGFFTAYKILYEIIDKRQRRGFILAILYSFMSILTTTVPVIITGLVISKLLGEQTQIFGFNVNISWSIGEIIAYGFLLLVGVRVIYNLHTSRQIWIISEDITFNIRDVAFKWALIPRKNLDLKMPVGDIVHRVNTASDNTRTMVEHFLTALMPALTVGVFALFVAFLINVYCGLIISGAIIIIVILVIWRKTMEAKLITLQETQLSKNGSYIVNTLQNLSLVHLFMNQNKEKLVYADKNQKYMQLYRRHSWIWSTYWLFAEIVKVGTVLGILAVAAFSPDLITVGSVYILMVFTGFVFEPIQTLGWFVGETIQEGVALKRLKELKPDPADVLGTDAKVQLSGQPLDKIELKNVSVDFAGEKKIDKINLTLEKHKVVILKGVSGKGKTTTMRVLCGITEKSGGEIIVNDKIRVLNMFGLVERMSVVMQGELILNRSVAENIFYAENLRDEQYRADVTEKMHITEIAARTHNEIGGQETANQLSGGEKKRIAVARALVKDAELYIFDEPTNELDNENAETVIGLIRELKKHAMVFVISHDSRTYKCADVLIEKV